MSALPKNNYQSCIGSCLQTLVECRRLLAETTPEEPCYSAAEECLQFLRGSVRMMRNESKFTIRYLVDCAEACERCATICEACQGAHCLACARACRECAAACQASSLL